LLSCIAIEMRDHLSGKASHAISDLPAFVTDTIDDRETIEEIGQFLAVTLGVSITLAIQDTGTRDCGEEYIYTVSGNVDESPRVVISEPNYA